MPDTYVCLVGHEHSCRNHPPRRSEAGRVPLQESLTVLPGPVGVCIANKVAPLPPEGEGLGEGACATGDAGRLGSAGPFSSPSGTR